MEDNTLDDVKLAESDPMPLDVFEKVQSELNPSPVRAFAFNTLKQKNAQFIQKGLSKPGRVSFDVLRRSVNSVHVARICVNVLKEKVTKTKWVIQPIDPLQETKEDGRIKEVANLLKQPNKSNETFRSFLDKLLEDLLVLDAVAIEKTRYPDGKLAELHYVDAATVRPVFDQFGNQDVEIPLLVKGEKNVLPVSYLQIFNNSKYGGAVSGEVVAAWPKKDFMYFHMHPQGAMENYGYGLSPLESVLSVVANLLNADNYNGTYFEEGAFPPIILQLVGQINQRDIQAYREYLYQELQGNFHRPAIMAGGAEAKVLNLKDFTNRDMQFMDYMKFLARLLAAAYGLSAQDVGLTDDLNRATSEVQKDLSEDKGYSSILHLLKEVINQEVLWNDFGYTDLEFDWVGDDSIDEEKAAPMFDTYLKNGVMTVNEVRQKLGELPFGEWADKPMVLGSSGYMPAVAAPPQPVMPTDEKGEPFGGNKGEEVKKSVYTHSGYKTYVDDRGYGQPFICYNVLTGKGYVVKPPAAVNLYSQDLEADITSRLAARGLNVPVVRKLSYWDVFSNILENDEIRVEFDKYVNMAPEYDSEKWRMKNGGSRKYPFYMVSDFIEGFQLNHPLLVADMKRDPNSYRKAIADLAAIWKVEKELVLGDRRADQYIITPQKQAFGFDYQFMGDEKRWKDTTNAVPKTLEAIPTLRDLFADLTKEKTEKSWVRKVLNSFQGQNPVIAANPSYSPSDDFEKVPVLFGELMVDEFLRNGLRDMVQHNSTGLMIENGFKEHSFTYDFGQASKALADYLKKETSSCGGIIKQQDERGIKYLVFVR